MFLEAALFLVTCASEFLNNTKKHSKETVKEPVHCQFRSGLIGQPSANARATILRP